jgi:putative hydroxymethylpyrimidine transport system substrate-binding protein
VTRTLACALAALLAALSLAACGAKREQVSAPDVQPLSLLLDYVPNADHAGIYLAKERGVFRANGLDVNVQVPSDPSAPLKLVAAGKVDLAISYEPELLLARDRGLRLVSVGALVQEPLTSIISLPKARIRAPRDLAGRTVATAGLDYQTAYLETIARRAGVAPGAIRQVDVGFNLVPALLSGRADATLGAYWNVEGVELARKGRRPQIIRIERAGVPTYDELVIVARADRLPQIGAKVRRFMRALGLAHQALRRDPQAGADALVAANRELDPGLQLAQVRATIPAFFAEPGRPFGWQDVGEWTRYGLWMRQNGLIRGRAGGEDALTNEFLPGQGI